MKGFKKVQSILLILVMLLSLFSGTGITAFADDPVYTGQTETSDYTISNAAQLAELARQVNLGTTYQGSTFTLTDDIDLSDSCTSAGISATWTGDTEWTPIAAYQQQPANPGVVRFEGTLDGDGHSIENIVIDKLVNSVGSDPYEGYSLFGVVGVNGTIKDLRVEGTVGSYRCAAGIAGYNYGTISGCFSEVSVAANGGGGLRGSGGIVGHNEGTVEYCINAGSVHNDYRRAGGIVGYNYGSLAKIDHCFSVGAVTSAGDTASDKYAGAIAATNGENTTTAGIIADCCYLKNSAATAVGFDGSGTSELTAFNANAMILDGSGNVTATTLKSVLNDPAVKFGDARIGAYPVLSWQGNAYEWDTSSIAIAASVTGGGISASVNGAPISGVGNKLVAGTAVVLTATAPDAGYLFTGFTATTGSTTQNLGGTAKVAPYALTYTVTGDATLGASYIPLTDNALTISQKAGTHGKSAVLATKTWDDMITASTTDAAGKGYMYTHGSDGWNMVAATQYVSIADLLAGVITPADTDSIIASAPDGSPGVYPTWQQLKNDLYFFPNATTSTTGGSIEGKAVVPSAIALSWAGGAVNAKDASLDTAAEALAATAAKTYNAGSLRMLYGSTEYDYTNIVAGSTIQGNRLWRGVTDLSVSKKSTVYNGNVLAAPLKDAANGDRAPYYTYSVNYDVPNQKASIAAAGLVSHTNTKGVAADWVSIGVPVPSGVSHSAIWVGTNNSEFSNVGPTADYFTQDGVEHLAISWDYNDIDPTTQEIVKYVQFSFDGGTTVYEIAVDTSGITSNAVNFCGIGLSLDMLKAHPTTAVYTMNGKSYTVTGMRISDILTYYAPSVKPAALRFDKAPGDTSVTVYNCPAVGTGTLTSPQYGGYDWSQAMLIWSQLEGSQEKISSGIKSAVNGGTGKMWWSGITSVTKMADAALTIMNTDGVYADRFVSLAQLKERSANGTNWVKNGKAVTTYPSVTGAAITDILTNCTPYGSNAASLYFSTAVANDNSNVFKSTTYSGITSGLDTDFNNGMVVWSSNVTGDIAEAKLYSALNGGSGKYWWSNIANMNVTLKNLVKFSVTPANAAVEVKNASGTAISAAAPNAYVLADGDYTYTVSASGYTSAAGTFTVAEDTQTITKALTETPGGGGNGGSPDPGATTYKINGYSSNGSTITAGSSSAASGETITLTVNPKSGYLLTALSLSSGKVKESVNGARTSYTFTMPAADVTVSATFEPVELIVYTQSGSGGTPAVGAQFSRAQLEDLATTKANPTTGYIYYKNEEWAAVVATRYVTLDALLADAGISFGSGDSITASAADNFYDTVSYSNYRDYQYYFDPNSNGAKSVAPYVIALEHYTGTLTGGSLASIVSGGSPTTKLRSCYGCSETQYKAKEAFGRRLVSSVESLTIIKGKEVNSNTKESVNPAVPVVTKEVTALEVKAVVAGGKATATVSNADINTAFSKIPTTAGAKTVVEISAVSGKEVQKAEVTFSSGAMDLVAKNTAVDSLKVVTDKGTLVFDKETLQGISEETKGAAAVVSMAQADKGTLSEKQQELVGDHPVYELSVSVGDKKISSFDGSVTVSLPYTLKEGENTSNIAIYHLNADGNVEKFQAVYDAATKTVRFTTKHFSMYTAVNEAAASFNDVTLTDWYYEAVNSAVSKGLMTGMTKDSFGPSKNTTRAMLVTILWRLGGSVKPATTASPFADVKDKASWYYDAVLWAYEKGIVAGLDAKTFGGDKTLSREQLVTILYRYAKANSSALTASGTIDQAKFNDWNAVPSWAADGFQWAYANGVVTGTTDSTLSPGANATRAQLASILQRYK